MDGWNEGFRLSFSPAVPDILGVGKAGSTRDGPGNGAWLTDPDNTPEAGFADWAGRTCSARKTSPRAILVEPFPLEVDRRMFQFSF